MPHPRVSWDAGRAFEQALSAMDHPKACGLLAPETRTQLEESEKQACAKALEGQDLPVRGEVEGVDVYGRQAGLGYFVAIGAMHR